jgi:hypothetical protein
VKRTEFHAEGAEEDAEGPEKKRLGPNACLDAGKKGRVSGIGR